MLVDADAGAGPTSLLSPGSGGEFVLSPDGQQVAIVRPTSISLMNTDGSDLRPDLVTYSPVITYSEFQYYAQPVWAPDSSALGVAIPSADPLAPAASGTLWRLPADGGPPTNLGSLPGDFYFAQVFGAPLISPELDRVAFLRDTATPNISDLYLANADGSGESLYANGDILWKGWAPDGLHFVYSLGPMNLQLGKTGEAPVPLGSGIRLKWINETDLMYLSGSMGAWTLFKGDITGASTPLVSPAGDFLSFDFDE